MRCAGLLMGVLLSVAAAVGAMESLVPIPSVAIHADPGALQRGAGVFRHYCSGCHALALARYGDLARGIGMVDASGQLLETTLKTYFVPADRKLTDPIQTAMPRADAQAWFGIVPPDLSLVTRVRGTAWLMAYLTHFYADPTRPWGVNNAVFPGVGMPHALTDLQGIQQAVWDPDAPTQLVRLEAGAPGLLDPPEYTRLVHDLVAFLDYVGEPHREARKRLGGWVLLFLAVFTLFAYLLKREYWKEIRREDL